MERSSKTEEGVMSTSAAAISRRQTSWRAASLGRVTLSLNTGSATSCGLTPIVKKINARTTGNRVSESTPKKLHPRRMHAAQGSTASLTPGHGTAMVRTVPSLSRPLSGREFKAVASAPKQPATRAAGTARRPAPPGGSGQAPCKDSACWSTRRFNTTGKMPGFTHAQLSGPTGKRKLLAIRADDASKAIIRAAAAMSKSTVAFGTTDTTREAAPKDPMAGEGRKNGGLSRTPAAQPTALRASSAAPRTPHRSFATGDTPPKAAAAAPWE
mmetsp:Transcript_6375/g.18194  ORF Transcript_6375/g.18194 Transcript_6375/m.18194 type:complete len:270 (-) Transcript_6375:680-1489(-)